jgi:NAD+ synthase (glutamine-hydrolysing)
MQVSMAQIRVKTGDISGNLSRILGALDELPTSTEVIVFPEMCISGYNCGCLFEYKEFIQDCMESLNTIVDKSRKIGNDVVIVVGGPRFADNPIDDSGNVRLHNSAFVIQNGKVIHIYDKQQLANDYHHEDRKYFVSGSKCPIVPHMPLAVLICEDIWHEQTLRSLYVDISIEHLHLDNPRVTDLLVLNFSYFCSEKLQKRHEIAKNIVVNELERNNPETALNVHYCNAVGIGDIGKNILIYDGGSFTVNSNGKVLSAPRYTSGVYSEGNMWTPTYPSWEEETYESITYAVRYAWEEFGLKKAQVHLSGGVDSSIVAVFAVEALGNKNVTFVTNPGEHTSKITLNLAKKVADKFGVELMIMPVKTIENAFDKVFQKIGKVASITKSTISAVGRSVFGLALTNQQFSEGVPTGILPTGNHTENYLGWCNFHDIGSIGVMQIIGDLTKTEIFALCEYINKDKYHNAIPLELLDGRVEPMAELDDTDVDPFDYYLRSGISAEMLRERATPASLVEQFDLKMLNKHSFPGDKIYTYSRAVFIENCEDTARRSQKSVYKSGQHAPILVLSKRSRGFSARETLINHYRWSSVRPTGRK